MFPQIFSMGTLSVIPLRARPWLALICLPFSLPAQPGDAPLVFTAGTTTVASGGTSWAFVTWWSTDATDWPTGPYALYAKTGTADSAAPYERIATVRPRTDDLALRTILQRGVELGFPADELENQLDAFFEAYLPMGTLRLTERLSILAIAGEAQPELRQALSTMAKLSPPAAMAMGRGHAFAIAPGETLTVEVRACSGDSSALDCNLLVGRVTLTGGSPFVLPQPGPPVHVPFRGGSIDAAAGDPSGEPAAGEAIDPRSDLNVPLRWGLTPALADAALLHGGYDLFRIEADTAVAGGFVETPPTPAEIAFLLSALPGQVHRVNRNPLLPSETISAAEALDPAFRPDLFFTVDDNDRYQEGSTAFRDGDEFYYYVAARDLLGRPGFLSEGTFVRVCSHMPPPAPFETEVENFYRYDAVAGISEQVFRVEWSPVLSERGLPIKEYRIYRWNSTEEMIANAGKPATWATPGGTGGLVGIVDGNTTEFIDDGPDAPRFLYARDFSQANPGIVLQHDDNRTHWYTVRAIEGGACGGNISFNGPIVWGVIRDRVGPGTGQGSLVPTCYALSGSVKSVSTAVIPLAAVIPRSVLLIVQAEREHPSIRSADIWFDQMPPGQAFLGRIDFPDGADIATGEFRITAPDFPSQIGGEFTLQPTIVYRDHQGRQVTLRPVVVMPGSQASAGSHSANFEVVATRVTLEGEDCGHHAPEDRIPGAGPGVAEINPLVVEFQPPPDATEWRLYRRIDERRPILIAEGGPAADPLDSIRYEDGHLPVAGGRVCYLLQCFDLHGNAGPMSLLGCIAVGPRADAEEAALPQPTLFEAELVGFDQESSGAVLTWFCPPHPVRHFILWIGTNGTRPPPMDFSDDLRPQLYYDSTEGFGEAFTLDDLTRVSGGLTRLYRTFPVGGNALGAGPEFSVTVGPELLPGVTYYVRVQAVGEDDTRGPLSNDIEFTWFLRDADAGGGPPPDPMVCRVGWPARLPPVPVPKRHDKSATPAWLPP
ncbi:MAG: hypothetical protein JJT96_05020 [Opitutales bacterium]|nr:hypothetical protein [Opitutales bacterium]